MNHHEQAAGAIIGGILGFIKSLTIITTLSWAAVFETAVLASVGAGVGFLITGVLKLIKKKLTK